MELKLIALLLVLGVFLFIAVTIGTDLVNANNSDTVQETIESLSCSSCGNTCNAESSCGLSTCGAVNGGSCGCN